MMTLRLMLLGPLFLSSAALVACADDPDQRAVGDAGKGDANVLDGSLPDGNVLDGSVPDANGPDGHPTSGAPCAPLPMPSTGLVVVSPAQASELQSILDQATSGTTVLLEDGDYPVPQGLRLNNEGVTLRSKSGNRSAVRLLNGYAQSSASGTLYIAASNVTVADLTAMDAYWHLVHVVPPSSGDIEKVVLYNLHLKNPAEQAVKINPSGNNDIFADYGLVACSTIELDSVGRSQVRGSCYTGGIDAHRALGWVLRDNFISGFWCPTGLAEHAIHVWTGSRDTVSERNVIHNSHRGIGYGMGENWPNGGRTYPDNPCPGKAYIGHFGGIIRNNFIFADDPGLFASNAGFDSGIELEQVCDTKVLHNTVYSSAAPYSSISWRFSDTTVTMTNNLVSHNLRQRDNAQATLAGNISGAPGSSFVDASAGDLHLAVDATAAIGTGAPVPPGDCDDDIDAEPRGAARDVGADQR
jgi:hypothetical protein